MRRHLVIMAKQAMAGRVKTRLGRDIGIAEATRVYRVLLGETLRRLTKPALWTIWIAITPDGAASRRRRILAQGQGDLGRRMQRLFDRLPAGPVIIVGSDIPGIAPGDVARAFHLLGEHDAVLGPASDGGYWLVGARRRPHVLRMFAAVRWSSPHALADTLAGLMGKRVGFVIERSDVDTSEDYRRWLRAS